MNMPVTRVASLLLVTVLSACGGSSSPMSNTNPPPTTHTDVLTYKNDVARTGQNLTETQLTLANVNSSSFGRLRTLATDGKVDAQPLYAASVSVQGASHNVVFVATEHDSVYAFDADSGANLWQVSLLGSAEVPSDTHNCSQVSPMIGITATPVIDRSAGANGTLYVVAMSKTSASPATYFQRLHALDLATGAELLNGPITIAGTYPMTGGTVTFEPNQYEERAALLLSGGTLYLSFTSHCDQPPYSGWVFAYSAATLTRTAVLNVAPNSGGAGPAIWMAGGGPAADAAGNIYLLTANGEFETTLNSSGFPSRGDYGNSFLKLTLSGSTLAVSDYFTMFNEVSESGGDVDLGSGGIMLLPDLNDASGAPRGLAVGAGKDGNLYVVERSAMGHFTAGSNHIWQQLSGVLGAGIWSTPAYFNGTVYYGPRDGALLAFPIASARLAGAPASRTATSFTYPGTAPAISANGTSNGIVWAHENSNPAVLHAYDAGDLMHELYNSSQASGGRDQLGAGNKFITPTIADGKVFVGTQTGVAEFGLLN
ncbi:MAG TPA: PQQ-binding-like beta-propeller repeat protein [Steroidobacteraceae bacterium]|nr:PQQ-binding-like beta-propeller repeat protein [Steroidobacteraceae bacterium]